MTISIYDATVPVFKRHLDALSAILDKAAAYAEAKKFDVGVLLNARLAPDMFNFIRQVQTATDFAKSAGARSANIPIPSFEDNETTLAQLQERIAKTVAFLDSLRPEQMAGAEAREITIKAGPRELTFNGQDYILHFALPNFLFHCATAYGILRHNGLEIGKRDFMRRL